MSKRTETIDPKTPTAPAPKAAAKTGSKTPSLDETLKQVLTNISTLSANVEGYVKDCNKRLDAQDKRLDDYVLRLERLEKERGGDEPAPEKKPTKKAKGEAAAKAAAETGASAAGGVQLDGVRRAYLYRDLKTKFVYVTTDLWAAKQGGCGEYDLIWAFYKNGQVDHILSPEEIRELFATPV